MTEAEKGDSSGNHSAIEQALLKDRYRRFIAERDFSSRDQKVLFDWFDEARRQDDASANIWTVFGARDLKVCFPSNVDRLNLDGFRPIAYANLDRWIRVYDESPDSIIGDWTEVVDIAVSIKYLYPEVEVGTLIDKEHWIKIKQAEDKFKKRIVSSDPSLNFEKRAAQAYFDLASKRKVLQPDTPFFIDGQEADAVWSYGIQYLTQLEQNDSLCDIYAELAIGMNTLFPEKQISISKKAWESMDRNLKKKKGNSKSRNFFDIHPSPINILRSAREMQQLADLQTKS